MFVKSDYQIFGNRDVVILAAKVRFAREND